MRKCFDIEDGVLRTWDGEFFKVSSVKRAKVEYRNMETTKIVEFNEFFAGIMVESSYNVKQNSDGTYRLQIISDNTDGTIAKSPELYDLLVERIKNNIGISYISTITIYVTFLDEDNGTLGRDTLHARETVSNENMVSDRIKEIKVGVDKEIRNVINSEEGTSSSKECYIVGDDNV